MRKLILTLIVAMTCSSATAQMTEPLAVLLAPVYIVANCVMGSDCVGGAMHLFEGGSDAVPFVRPENSVAFDPQELDRATQTLNTALPFNKMLVGRTGYQPWDVKCKVKFVHKANGEIEIPYSANGSRYVDMFNFNSMYPLDMNLAHFPEELYAKSLAVQIPNADLIKISGEELFEMKNSGYISEKTSTAKWTFEFSRINTRGGAKYMVRSDYNYDIAGPYDIKDDDYSYTCIGDLVDAE